MCVGGGVCVGGWGVGEGVIVVRVCEPVFRNHLPIHIHCL